jgi:uncharacterized protein YndB with AHSA1/START domain
VSAIEASVSIPAPPEALYERLAKLENHWALADRWVEVVSLNGDGHGGEVRLNGPLGLSRTARTTVDRLEPPSLIEGTASVGNGTRGRVRWTFINEGEGTLVTLRAELVEAGMLDRSLWDLGGRNWLEGRLRVTLERLRSEYLTNG